MPTSSRSVNLLPKSEFESSLWGRVLRWALTTGRRIVILTEIIVIAAFLSRFKLDSDLQIISESIAQKKAILESSSAFEKQFLSAQAKIATADLAIKNQLAYVEILDEFRGTIPEGVNIGTIMLSPQGISTTLTTNSETLAFESLSRLDASERWKSLSLSNLSVIEGSEIKLGISLGL